MSRNVHRFPIHINDLPEEILRIICSQLPITSLLMGRAVCKLWNRTISSLDLSTRNESFVIAHLKYHREYALLINTAIDKCVSMRTNLPRGEWFLCDSSEGLWCLSNANYNHFDRLLVFNPITRASVEVACPRPHMSTRASEEIKRELWKFYSYKDTREWKLVLFIHKYKEVNIYSSVTQTWTVGQKPPLRGRYIPQSTGSSNPLPVCDYKRSVAYTYDFKSDTWEMLEGNLPTIPGECGIFTCMGHGTFIITALSRESQQGRLRMSRGWALGVYKYDTDVLQWDLVSVGIECCQDKDDVFYFSDGLENIWAVFCDEQVMCNYNVALDVWSSFRGFDPSFNLSQYEFICSQFGFKQP